MPRVCCSTASRRADCRLKNEDALTATRQRCTVEAPPPLRFRPDLPVGLSDVISALIRLKPEERPASARRVIALLNEREGTEFPYETPETRSAYIRSAVDGLQSRCAHGTRPAAARSCEPGACPPAVVVLGRVGAGAPAAAARFRLGSAGGRHPRPRALTDRADDATPRAGRESADRARRGSLSAATNWPKRCAARKAAGDAGAFSARRRLTPRLPGAGRRGHTGAAAAGSGGVRELSNATFPENSFAPYLRRAALRRDAGLCRRDSGHPRPPARQRATAHRSFGLGAAAGAVGFPAAPGGQRAHPADAADAAATGARRRVRARLLGDAAAARRCSPDSAGRPPARASGCSLALDTLLRLDWLTRTDDGCALRFPAVADLPP